MNRKIIILLALALSSGILSCQSKVKDPIVKVGRETIGKDSFEAFKKTARIYPSPLPHYFPGQRQPVSFMAECEAIYQSAKSKGISAKITSSLDWEWKKRYFTASLFFDLLGDNLGFTNSELEDYYKKNKEAFRVTTQTADGQDSSFIPEFDGVKRQAADILFYDRYKPDSAFLARISGHDHDHDSATVRNHWLYNARSNPADFFMRQFIKEQTGAAYADSVQQIYGEGKPIVSDDIDIIRSWVPEGRRESMRMKELIEWLYKWKIFSERAVKMGLANGKEYKDMMHWALRIEHASQYLESEVLPAVSGKVQTAETDTALAMLAIFDLMGRTDRPADFRIAEELQNIGKTRLSAKIDSVIHGIRKNAKITFLQDEWKDERSGNPTALLAKADSLRDAAADAEADDDANTLNEAENIYRTLTNDFAFSAEGRKAFNELAKIQIDKYNAGPRQERYLLSSAVSFYRKGQILDSGEENLCNSYFMIGFTYDEYLKNYHLAEANYKWILRNAPSCALASDAEFMLQHLDEPMTSIEEIQGQSMRQGRKVELDDDADDDAVTETVTEVL